MPTLVGDRRRSREVPVDAVVAEDAPQHHHRFLSGQHTEVKLLRSAQCDESMPGGNQDSA